MTSAPHVLVVTEDPCPCKTPCDCPPEYACAIECPGVSDDCRAWWECMDCSAKATQDEDFADSLMETEEAHGVEHRLLSCGWATWSADCWAQNYDELHELVRDLFGDDVPVGRYPVKLVADDEYLVLKLLSPVSA